LVLLVIILFDYCCCSFGREWSIYSQIFVPISKKVLSLKSGIKYI